MSDAPRDRLASPDTRPDRLFYATGVFLSADDLEAEQLYHRAQLARTLTFLHGTGTAAGLKLTWSQPTDELEVSAGIAVDRLGRLIEVPRKACLRLQDWFDHQLAERHSAVVEAIAGSGSTAELVADVFLAFQVCERGRTPAFAFGPYDAIDAAVPDRLRDGYTLTLELRGGDTGALPADPWPAAIADFPTFLGQLRDAVLDGVTAASQVWEGDALLPEPGMEGISDPSAVFLGRVRLPVTVAGDEVTRRVADAPVFDNHARRFVYSSQVLLRLIEAASISA